MNIFYRSGRLFKINPKALSKAANHTQVINGLYAAVYEEFKDSAKFGIYSQLNGAERFAKLNEFALNWLKQKGLM